jgi:uncharacterized membrane protein
VSLKRSFLIGLLCGLRSQTPPAITAWRLAGKADYLPWPLRLIGKRGLRIVQTLGMGIELVGDKLPITPSRTERRGVIARVIAGGGTGACVAPVGRQVPGLALGVAGALIGTYGGHALRVRLPTLLGIPDLPIALLEDAIAIGGALVVTQGLPPVDDLAYLTE